MKRMRKDATKVWHNPEIASYTRRGERVAPEPAPAPARSDDAAAAGRERGRASPNRAALEALFAPKVEGEARKPGRIVAAQKPGADPRVAEQKRLLAKLLHAEGRPAVSKAATEYVKAGFAFPVEQDVFLQLLEHASEDQVREAVLALGGILETEAPKRRAMLESRLRRIEQFADEADTRAAAEALRRRVAAKASS
ncbi:MAG TPA: hypothetical protein VGM56_00035 [Byssovorax sp.]|jgi:hypothetical protein